MALLVVVTAASWVSVVWLSTLPSTDDSGRMVLYYYWHHTSGFWSTAVLSLMLAAGLIFQIVRHVHGRWRVMTMVVGGGAWLYGAAHVAALVIFMVLLIGVEGTQTIARGSDGTMVMITQDGFDGDIVDVWRPSTSVIYLREPGLATVDPRSGRAVLTARRGHQ